MANGDVTPQSNSLYRNRMNSANRFLQLHLDGNASNFDAIGAKVRMKAVIGGQAVWQLREATSQSGYNSHSSYELYFGLGDAIAADTLAIYWPSGWVQVLTDVPAGQFLSIAEDSLRVVGLNGGEETPERFELRQNYPNPFNPATVIEYRLPDDSAVRLSVFNLLGQKVVTLVNARQPAGVYEVRWDGRDAVGRPPGQRHLPLPPGDAGVFPIPQARPAPVGGDIRRAGKIFEIRKIFPARRIFAHQFARSGATLCVK